MVFSLFLFFFSLHFPLPPLVTFSLHFLLKRHHFGLDLLCSCVFMSFCVCVAFFKTPFCFFVLFFFSTKPQQTLTECFLEIKKL